MSSGPTFNIDLHVHSEGSYDGHEPVDLILEHARNIDLDGVVITDHDTITESLRAAELAPEFDLVGIPGVEVSTADGHLLAIGVEEVPPRGRSFEETVEIVRDLGGAAVVPHPFQRTRHGVRRRNITECDAVEVYNSMLFTGYRNRRARKFAEREGYAKVGASDAHYLPNVGRAYTELTVPSLGEDVNNAAVDYEELVAAIRNGETQTAGKRTPIPRSVKQYTKGALRKGVFEVTRRTPMVATRPQSMLEA